MIFNIMKSDTFALMQLKNDEKEQNLTVLSFAVLLK